MGTTGSGKSHLARTLAVSATRRGPVLIVDPAGSKLTELPGAVTFHEAGRRTNQLGQDWTTAPVARFVPVDPYDTDAYDWVYRWAWSARHPETGAPLPRWVWCDEAGMVLPVRKAPTAGVRVLVQGRKRAIGHLACHTRPRDIARDLIAQTQHLALFRLPNPADRAHVADVVGIELAALESAMGQLGEFEFLWWSEGAPLRHCSALPA